MCNIDSALNRLLEKTTSAAQTADSFLPLAGLSGKTWQLKTDEQWFIARAQPAAPLPGVERRREYRILKTLSGSGIAPAVKGFDRRWLLLEWIAGTPLAPHDIDTHLLPLVEVLKKLHCQPLSGHMLSLSVLLQQYWQQSCPSRRHYRWYRALKTLQRRGEPRPLRRALLHMDIHPDNIIKRDNSLVLIDWEYAGDGDVALELAAVIASNPLTPTQQLMLVSHYAARQHLHATALHKQIARWQPWLRLLVASWYEARWQQTKEPSFLSLADNAWQHISTNMR